MTIDMTMPRNPRVGITLPLSIKNALERWAESEGNAPSALAGWIVETAVREALDQGRIPSEEQLQREYKTISELVTSNMETLKETKKFTTSRLKALSKGEPPTEVELLRIALILGLTEDYVTQLRK